MTPEATYDVVVVGGGGKSASAATDDNDVVGGLGRHGDCLARWPAVVPAILPNTEPFIRPVPPG